MANDYKIEKNIPIPSIQQNRSRWKDLINKMNVGDSVVVNVTQRSALIWAARMAGKYIITRNITEKGKIRVWLINKKGE